MTGDSASFEYDEHGRVVRVTGGDAETFALLSWVQLAEAARSLSAMAEEARATTVATRKMLRLTMWILAGTAVAAVAAVAAVFTS